MLDVFSHPEFDHEVVTFGANPASGLKAIIAVHNTHLGPAIGGCRMMAYPSEGEALKDVLRLSRGMTYKCAIGGIPFGGGKAVIIGDPERDKSEALLHAMGEFVDSLDGRYITSFDAGTSLDDVAKMGERTAHVGGIREGAGNASASTALGVFKCLVRSVELTLDGRPLSDLRVAIQGLGNVGWRLAEMLSAEGVRLVVSDVFAERADRAAAELGAEVVPPNEILLADADVFAPCAYGGILTPQTVAQLKVSIVCGGANNQLSSADVADQLRAREILYCPDYVANAGGIIDLHYQLNEATRDDLPTHLEGLVQTYSDIFDLAQSTQQSMASAADKVAEARFLPAMAR